MANANLSISADFDALLDDVAGPARIEDGPQLHPETLRRICCESAATVVAHHRAGRPGTSMDVGRRTRVVPATLRRALFLRDHGCRFPGGAQKRFVDAHHARHWSRGGPTSLANLLLLCRQHHRLVHEGGFGLDADGQGRFTFRRPDGVLIAESPLAPGGRASALSDQHLATVSARTAVPDWRGEHLELEYTV